MKILEAISSGGMYGEATELVSALNEKNHRSTLGVFSEYSPIAIFNSMKLH